MARSKDTEVEKRIRALEAELFKQELELRNLFEKEAEEMAGKSLFHFYKASWSVFEKGEFKSNWHHQAICEALEALYRKEIPNLIIQIPPGTGKSTLCSVAYPVWCWIQDPSIRFISASAQEQLAYRDPGKSRRIIEDPWFQNRWGDKFSILRDVNRQSKYENDQKGYRLAITPTSKRGIGERYDIFMCDDPHAPGEMYSKAAKDIVWRWWSELISTRGSETGRQCIIHQRLAVDDLIGRIIKNSDLSQWEILSFPMEYELNKVYVWTNTNSLPNRDPRKEKNELLWPEVHSPARVKSTKAKLSSPRLIAAQLQQRPVAVEGGLVKKSNFRYYTYTHKPSFLGKFRSIFTSWDLTFGDEGKSFCVGQVWGTIGSSKFLIDQVRGRWSFPEQIKQLKALAKKYPSAKGHLIEKKANGEAMKTTLDKDVSGLIWVKPSDVGGSVEAKDKVFRLSCCLPTLEAGNVYLPKADMPGYEWISHFIEECISFPVGENDDCLDCMTQFLNYIAVNSAYTGTVILEDKELEAFIDTSIEKGLLSEKPTKNPFKITTTKKGFVGSTSRNSMRSLFD